MPRRPNIINEQTILLKTSETVVSHELRACVNNKGVAFVPSSSTEEGNEGCSYIKMEPGAEEAAAHAIVNSRKASRRKQSKPIRVYLDIEKAEMPQAAAEGVEPAASRQDNGSPAENEEKEETGMEIDSSLACDLSNDTFPNRGLLNQHIQSVHNMNNNSVNQSSQNNEVAEAFPTKYHRLGSELQEAAMNSVVSVHSPDQRFSPSSQCDASGDNQGLTSGDNASKSNRIFHQDAYCELCSREFCNKYFLKTHKANKHGIYENGNCNVSNGEPNGYTSLVTQQPLSETSLVSSDTESSLSAASVPPQSQPAPPPQVTPPQPIEIKPAEPTPSKPPPDMEDYCEICQKHFCNKYYLKKHKQDVHGIIPDTPPAKRSRTMPSSSSSGSSIASQSANATTTSSISTSIAPAHLSIPQTPSAIAAANANSLPNMTSMANVMFINPFAPPVAIIQAQPVLQAAPTGFVPQGISPLPQVLPPVSTPDPTLKVPPMDSAHNVSLPNDALRGIGVLNADAYCELCRKEFCNKYFLKIHKANKHGIYIPDDSPEGQPSGFVTSASSIPEGLSAAMSYAMANTGTSTESSSKTPKGKESPSATQGEEKNKSEKSDEEEYICKPCNKEFASKYSLKVHNINVHAILPPGMNMGQPPLEGMPALSPFVKIEPGEQPQPLQLPLGLEGFQPMSGVGPAAQDRNMSGTIFGNMIAAKLADRVVCDICNKEVCNKYFLKTHKLKVHGVDLNSENSKTKEDIGAISGAADMSINKTPVKMDEKRPKDEELLKMGIDPEAYCEICKKEFCSKYFLKTHKLNIHGIKGSDSIHGIKGSDSITQATISNVSLSSLPLSMSPLSQSFNPAINTTPNVAKLISSGEAMDKGSERRTWKWKEPINATRVMCELCNKELCNKYFLKTHMLNKHGLYYDHLTGQSAPSPSASGITNTGTSQPSPFKYNKESSNDSQSAITAKAIAKKIVEETRNAEPKSQKSSTAKQLDFGEMAPNSALLSDVQKDSNDVAPGMVVAKTWSVPSQEGGDNETEEAIYLKKDNPVPNGSIEEKLKECTEGFIQKCDICGLLFGEALTLQYHKMHDHKQTVESEKAKDATQPADLKLPVFTNIGLSLKKKYQRGVKCKFRTSRRWRRLGQGSTAIGEKVKSAIMNHIQNHQRRKKFRCAHCQDRFFSRAQCQAHIRAEHPSARSMDSSNYVSDQNGEKPGMRFNNKVGVMNPSPPDKYNDALTNGGNNGDFPVSIAKPVQLSSNSSSSQQGSYVMQAFKLQANAEEQKIAPSIVYLPVAHKITEPLDVAFKLTPADH